MLVHECMTTPAVTVRTDQDYKVALRLMDQNALHHLPVMDTQGSLVGMAAERDLLITATRFLNANIEIGEIMHRGVVTAAPDMSIGRAAGIMAERRLGSLPVVDGNGCLVGIITETDILKNVARTD